jgi:gluconolactonase
VIELALHVEELENIQHRVNMDVVRFVVASVQSLDLEKRLSPRRNPEVGWFYVFLPAFVTYIMFLTKFLNARPEVGTIEVFNSSLSSIIDLTAKIEVLVNGTRWAEGPLWVEDAASSANYLLFSETMRNTINKWEEGRGIFTVGKTRLYDRTGCKLNTTEHCTALVEPGSNGLLRTLPTHYPGVATTPLELVVCQHGDRAISIFHDNGTRTVVTDNFKGRRFNSPNDAVWGPEGNLYFTDPPYGLYTVDNSTSTKKISDRQLPFSGVFMIKAEAIREVLRTGRKVDGEKDVRLVHKDMKRPNGLAFSPDYSKLYVSNSEESDAYWKVFDVTDSGGLSNGAVFFNYTDAVTRNGKVGSTREQGDIGHPDGLKIDIFGNMFAAGPGGVFVFSPDGDWLGRIRVDSEGAGVSSSSSSRIVSNVGFGNNGMLYITASDIVASVKTKTRPMRPIL